MANIIGRIRNVYSFLILPVMSEYDSLGEEHDEGSG